MLDGNSTLFLGDCLDQMANLKDKSVDLILCDLPYGTTQNRWDVPLDLDLLWVQYRRVCSGAIVLSAQTPYDKVLGASNLGWLRYEWIWEKSHPTGHLNARKCPLKAHENILVFYNTLPVYNPIKTHGHPRKTATKRADASSNYGAQSFDQIRYDSTERYPRSVLKFPSDKQLERLHPTQKPVALMEYFVQTYTDPDGVVLDNCMGSGTTGVACLRTGRKFIGIEKDPQIYQVAVERISCAQVAA